MTAQDINNFFLSNPHLKVKAIQEESGIPKGTFEAIKRGTFSISAKNEEKLTNVFKKYNKKWKTINYKEQTKSI